MTLQPKKDFDDRSAALRLFDAVTAMACKAGMERDSRVVKTLRLISANPDDLASVRKSANQIIQLIKSSPQFLAQQHDRNPYQPYPGSVVNGPITFGTVYNPYTDQPTGFGLEPHELNQNLLMFGRAGSGKTVTLFLILMNLIRLSIPHLIVDFKKDYRHWIRRCRSLLVFNWRTFKFNPLAPPPGTDPVYWIQIVVELFFDAFFP